MLLKNKNFLLFLSFFLPMFFVYSIWLILFFPGILSPDSVDQMIQAETLKISNWHPYFSTLYLIICLSIYNSPATVGFVNILILSAFSAYAFSFFWKNEVNKKILIILFVFLMFSIPIGLYNITLWKDIPFSVSLLIVSFLFAKKYFEAKEWNLKELSILLILSLGATLFRHNGIIFIVLIPILFLISFNKERYKFYFVTVYVVLSIFFISFFPNFIGVVEKPKWITGTNLFAYYMSANIYANQPQTYITKDLKLTLEKAFDKPESIKELYNDLYWDSLFFNEKQINHKVFDDELFWKKLKNEFYFNNLLPNIDYIVASRFNSFFATTLGFGHTHGINSVEKTIYSNKNSDCGFRNNYIFKNTTHKLAKEIFRFSSKRKEVLGRLVWNSLIPILFIFFFAFVSIIRNEKKVFLVFVSLSIVQILALFVFSIASDWRYYYFAYLLFFFAIPFYLLDNKKKNNL